MENKKRIWVRILTAGGKTYWAGWIYPMTVCGSRYYDRRFQLASETGCLATDSHHQETSGRDQQVIDVPKGFELLRLSYPGACSLQHQLPNDGQVWSVDTTVHSEWKIRKRQEMVLIKKSTD